MIRSPLQFLVGAAIALAPAQVHAQVSAEPWFQSGTFMITVEAGGAAFSDFDRSQARLLPDEAGLGDFQRRISARTSGSAGVWASYWLGKNVGLRGGLAWVPSGFTVWNEELARRAIQRQGGTEEARYAGLNIWLLSGAVVLRAPRSFGRVIPYGVLGGGVIQYDVSDSESLPPEARDRFADGAFRTPAALLGLGALLPLQRQNLLLSFEITNHLSRAPLSGGRREEFQLSGVDMALEPGTGSTTSDEVGYTSHLRLAVGLTLPLRAR